MLTIPVLPIEILIEIACIDMFAFGILIRTCKAIWQPFKSLTRHARMSKFMKWHTRLHLFYSESYWEYIYNGRAVAHVVKLRYDDSGRILQEAEMWLGRRWGKCITYYRYDTHTLLESACIRTRAWYVDGQVHGKLYDYHDNGILWCDCNYVYGKLHGEFRSYHDNGRLHQIKHYDHGEAVGEWIEYDSMGAISAHGVCDTGSNGKRRCVIL